MKSASQPPQPGPTSSTDRFWSSLGAPAAAALLLAATGAAFVGSATDAIASQPTFAAGEARGDDLEALQAQLEINPDDSALLMEAAQAAFADANDDAAIWYAELARLAAADPKDLKKVEKDYHALRSEIGVEIPAVGQAIDDYSKEIFGYAKSCASAKFYANAADMLGSLGGTPYEREATSRLTKLFNKDKAVKAMLDSGVPVKVVVRKKYSDKKLAKLNEKHSDWEEAFELKGTNYSIKTNMGVEWAEATINAMEQMNLFYRKIFEHKERGGKMKRCVVYIYKTRAEFDAYEGMDPNVAGFYRPDANSVHAYDPRTAEGHMQGDIEEYWSTLYHEASHQFTQAVWKNEIPTWLNEGTASYFEGAALLPGGFVETNRIPAGRLRSLVALLGLRSQLFKEDDGKSRALNVKPEEHPASPGLKAVVSHMAPGSYPGEYYPFGWGLVYFCLNYENKDAERVYEPIYREFMRSYTESDGEKSPYKRFVQYFVDEAEIDGVKTFEDFELVWINWIAELARREYGEPDQAAKLIADAQNEISHEKFEYAIQSLRWALRKRADDPTALKLLGQSYEEVDNKDAALFIWRRLAEVARRAPKADEKLKLYEGTAAEALETALSGLKSVNSSIGSKMEEGVPEFVEKTLAEANSWAEAGYPRVALQVIKLGVDLLGGDGELKARATELMEEHEIDVRRTRRIPTADLEGWNYYGGNWQALEEDMNTVLENPDDKISEATLNKLPPKTFLYEVDIEVSKGKDAPLVGLTYAGTMGQNTTFIRTGKTGRFALLEFDPDTKMPIFNTDAFKKGPPSPDGKLTMGIDVGLDFTRFLVNGEEVGRIELPAAAFEGQLGVATWGAARFVNPRITR